MDSFVTLFIASFNLLVFCTLPSFIITGHPKTTNESLHWGYIPASTTVTTPEFDWLTPIEIIVLYVNLVLAAATITGLYSCIRVHKKLSRNHSIPSRIADAPTYAAPQIKDHIASGLARPNARTPRTERGPSKPAIQIQGIPTYVEKLAQSPTEERTFDVPDANNLSTQVSDNRGRTDAVAQANAIGQPVLPSSAQLGESVKIRPLPCTKSHPRKVHTAPCSSTSDHLFRPPVRKDTLLGSLKGFQLHTTASGQKSSVHVLGVGLSWSHLEKPLLGPAHDIRWLEEFFSYQEQVHFTPLQDEKASFGAIHQNVARMYTNAHPDDCLILYFTGHGDEQNAFELYDQSSGSLNEVILNSWIVELKRETSKRIPVYIIFDFCRDNPVRSNAQLDGDVSVFWSCPPGQKSLDMRLSDDLPYSCFLTAVLLAIYDSSKSRAISPIKSFAFRITELLNVLWGTRCYRPGPERRKRWCRHPYSSSCKLCMDPKHDSPNNEWPNLGLFGALDNMHLGALHDFSAAVRYASIRFPLPIRKVHQLLMNNFWFMYFNPSRISTNKGSSTRKLSPNDSYVNPESARGMTLPLEAILAPPTTK